jgi:hypothetical protein
MSKFLNVPYGDYVITVQDGGAIRLDTGLSNGEVIVTGDLTVLGETTTVNTTTLTVEDNIITVNSLAGAVNEAGIEVARDSKVTQKFVFDETINYTSPTLGAISGAWHLKDENDDLAGIRTNVIDTAGGDLYLINSGQGVVSVTETNNYEYGVFNYTSANTINVLDPFGDTGAFTTPRTPDDDNIPNGRAVADFITSYFATVFYDKISEGSNSLTYVETKDFEITGELSRVEVGIDNQLVAEFYNDRLDVFNLRLQDSTLSATDSGQDLVLMSPGTGSVRINDTLHIDATPTFEDATLDPSLPTGGIKLYSKTPGYGDTGLYFANSASRTDEVISNNKALIYSMLF